MQSCQQARNKTSDRLTRATSLPPRYVYPGDSYATSSEVAVGFSNGILTSLFGDFNWHRWSAYLHRQVRVLIDRLSRHVQRSFHNIGNSRTPYYNHDTEEGSRDDGLTQLSVSGYGDRHIHHVYGHHSTTIRNSRKKCKDLLPITSSSNYAHTPLDCGSPDVGPMTGKESGGGRQRQYALRMEGCDNV